jgi:hypothetical protein
VDGVKEGYR